VALLAICTLLGSLLGDWLGILVTIKLAQPYDWISNLGWHYIDVGHSIRFLTGVFMALSIVRTFKTLSAVRALQSLRTSVQVSDAEASERAAANRAAQALQPISDQGGAKYGAFRDMPADDKDKRRAKS
jgi:hypothetical protein